MQRVNLFLNIDNKMTWLFEAAAASELFFIVCCLGIYNSSEGPKSK